MKSKFKLIWNGSKGKAFEDLVYKLLNCMFPNTIFKQTDYVHDGGKDFYSIGNYEDEKIWIEAKNYNEHLELSKFSNTFIMADISEVNRIIIFSMSEITKGAKTNIARYAAYHKKSISTYSGSDVLFLIHKYKNAITMSDFIENTEELFQELENVNEPCSRISVKYEYYYAKQFNLAYRRDKENYISQEELYSLPLHSLIAQEVHITNHDLFCEKVVKIDFSEYHKSYLETYLHSTVPEELVIPPAATYIIVIFIKIADIYSKIQLPNIHFDDINISIESLPCKVRCCWLGEIPYIGEGWAKLQNTINSLNINPAKKIVLVEGKSGVGKTRFLQEISGYHFQKGYRIISIDFHNIEDLSLKNALLTILNNIFVLDNNMSNSVIYIEEFGSLYKDFYDILFNEYYDFYRNIDKLCMLFVSLLRKKRIILLIDNMQAIDSKSVLFFQRLFHDITNHSDLLSRVIVCFNTDFLLQEKESFKLLLNIRNMDSTVLVELINFSKDDAKLYLLECLDPRRLRKDIHFYFDNIIDNFGTNPLILKQVILYLKQCNIINFEDSTIYISNLEHLKIALSELPKGIHQIIQYRYSHLIANVKTLETQNVNRIIWCILFFGNLSTTWISKLHFKHKDIRPLMDYGFIEYNQKSQIVFCHQLIEKSFCHFFSGTIYAKNPSLVFIEDDSFLESLFQITNKVGKINFCIENILLQSYLNKTDNTDFNLALKRLKEIMPRAIMLPLILNTVADYLNCGIQTEHNLEFQALYALSTACQERFDVSTAAKYMQTLIEYEKRTYHKKLDATSDMILLFKNHVFQLPIDEKYTFLDWLIHEKDNFILSEKEYMNFSGWIYNRYSKNLCSEHRFEEASLQAQQALDIALTNNDFCSAAEAEIEYGNIFAYNNAIETAKHWEKSIEYISMSGSQSTYFEVYKYGYSILCAILNKNSISNLSSEISHLINLREKTFLYQKLFIDDICIDYYIIQYLDGNFDLQTFKKVIPQLHQMKADSLMHTSYISLLATYKLFTVYRLICMAEPSSVNIDTTFSYILELIKADIFIDAKLPYSKMILYEILVFCSHNPDMLAIVEHELSGNAKILFTQMNGLQYKKEFEYAITPLSNVNRNVNLLHFNYIF